jgi:hypothetical protein
MASGHSRKQTRLELDSVSPIVRGGRAGKELSGG